MTTEENKANATSAKVAKEENEYSMRNIHKEIGSLIKDLRLLDDNAQEIRTDIEEVHKELIAHIEAMKTKTLISLNDTLDQEKIKVQVRLKELHYIRAR